MRAADLLPFARRHPHGKAPRSTASDHLPAGAPGLHVPEGGHDRITHNTPFRAGKGFLYEGGLRIPLIARWPGKIPAGRVIDAPVTNLDWAPALFECAGIPIPAGLDGTSMLGLLAGKAQAADRMFFWHFPHYTNQGSRPAGAVREGPWKLIERYEDGRVELYNLAADPGEREDMAAKEPERTARLRGELAAWRKAAGAQGNEPNPRFDPALGRPLYEDIDVSRYEPAKASAGERERILEWRKGMNQAVR